jgi:hypothetical protein
MKPGRDVTIRRCTLRVTRRGGWSWGADAPSLVRRAIERLPAMLERRLGALGESLPADFDMVQPLRLRVSLQRQEWAELSGGSELSAPTRVRLEAAIDSAVTQALPATMVESARTVEVSEKDAMTSEAADTSTQSPLADLASHSQPSALWKLLLQWRTDGKLLAQLASLGEPVLLMWLERLIEVETSRAPATPDEADVPELWQEVCALPLLMPAGSARTLARGLIFALELKARWAPGSSQTRELLARFCAHDSPAALDTPLKAAQSAETAGFPGAPAAATRLLTTDPATVSAPGAPSFDSAFEVDIPCALPFLLLTPLARCGYLATLAAALEAANASSLAAGVALGLAHKCLAAPQRGWLRDAGALAAATAFAGLPRYDNELILNAGRALRPQLAVLDSCTTDQLIRGHRPEACWLVASGALDALVLFDEDGLAPVATGSLTALAARIAPSAGVLFLPAQAASAEHLDTLDELQIPYASDANLVSRTSAVSFIAPDGTRLWVSVHGAQQGRARALAERGATLTEAALVSWSAVHAARNAQRPGVDASFETSLSLAACFALSAIARALWMHRASTTALATVENFADLDAHVRVTPEGVQVTLPMGRRAWDLRDHGLLADVRDVPWLGGRVVTFGVG